MLESAHLLTSFVDAKMTSVMALDGITLFLCSKDVTIHVNVCDTVKLLEGILQCNGGQLKKLKTSNVFLVVYYVSVSCSKINNELHAHDLICTIELQTVNYYSTIHC